MPIKLKSRELPTVQFRRVLPDYLGPDDEECFIAIEARAGGAINPRYVELTEKGFLSARVMDRKCDKIKNDQDFVEQNHKNVRQVSRNRFAALYDACVISWSSNIQTEDDDGQISGIDCTRENFLALFEEKVPELANALLAFESECVTAGKVIKEDDDDTIKN